MPDNELDELADNFFCHLHNHSHENHDCESGHADESNDKDLIDSLNPLRDKSNLRKSILMNSTLMIMNQNHLNLDKVSIDLSNKINCKNCSSIIGFKGG